MLLTMVLVSSLHVLSYLSLFQTCFAILASSIKKHNVSPTTMVALFHVYTFNTRKWIKKESSSLQDHDNYASKQFEKFENIKERGIAMRILEVQRPSLPNLSIRLSGENDLIIRGLASVIFQSYKCILHTGIYISVVVRCNNWTGPATYLCWGKIAQHNGVAKTRLQKSMNGILKIHGGQKNEEMQLIHHL